MRTVVERFKLSEWVGQEAVRAKLVEAGFRGQGPYIVFLFFRMVAPVGMLCASLIYVFLVIELDIAWTLKLGICIGATYLGINLPNLFIKNRIQRRQASINRAFPDALDLLLICVESGMSLEVAFKRVSEEIGDRTRRRIYAGDGRIVLPVGPPPELREPRQAGAAGRGEIALHGLAAERTFRNAGGDGPARDRAGKSRPAHDRRRKEGCGIAAALTVPMIVFFLPVLFIVILGPAVIKVMQIQ
jgi:tight adherence protein C